VDEARVAFDKYRAAIVARQACVQGAPPLDWKRYLECDLAVNGALAALNRAIVRDTVPDCKACQETRTAEYYTYEHCALKIHPPEIAHVWKTPVKYQRYL
jgi:hypothetical protein